MIMTFEEAQAVVATKTAPKVTKESIEAKIIRTDFTYDEPTTICIIELENGFRVIGHSTPASLANFDADVGRAYAYDNAFRQLWQLEGYLLREQLHKEATNGR
jgi:Phage protein (N4 Gp49/phage Sf6 gene 66) family